MIPIVKIIKSIKVDNELLDPEEAKTVLEMVKRSLLAVDQGWRSCSERPYRSVRCLIGYSDGEIITGQYIHNSDFDRGGFFTSMKEFEPNNIGEPEFWMPVPQLPKVKREQPREACHA